MQSCLQKARALDALLRHLEADMRLPGEPESAEVTDRDVDEAAERSDFPGLSSELGVQTHCPSGHLLTPQCCKEWDTCSNCGFRPATWNGSTERAPYLCCSLCELRLCGDCNGIAKALKRELSPEQRAYEMLQNLAEKARKQPASQLVASGDFELGAQEGSPRGREMHAFVVGRIVRQIVSQGRFHVCGAAATAAALNACTEAVRDGRRRLRLTWEEILFGHFQEKFGLQVHDEDGSPVSWKVGKGHIRQVIEQFPGMLTRSLIGLEQAAPAKRAAAWKSLVIELRKPRTAVYYHTQNRKSGHYTLIAGASGPALPLPNQQGRNVARLMPYDPQQSAIFTNQFGQEPLQRVTFENVCDHIIRNKGFYCIFVVEYKGVK